MRQYLAEHYNIGPINKILPTENDHCFMIEADRTYVYKRAIRRDFVEIQQHIAPYLTRQALAANEVILTTRSQAINSQGYYLATAVPGQRCDTLTAQHIPSIFAYLKRYHHVLQDIPFTTTALHDWNHWDDAGDNTYLRDELAPLLTHYPFSQTHRQCLDKAIRVFSQYYGVLEASPKQLVHSDLGPGNILFQGCEVTGIIDFTPSYDHELYAVSQLAYWYILYPRARASKEHVLELFRPYYDDDTSDASMETLMSACLLKAALFRFTGYLLEKQALTKELLKRMQIISDLLHSP